MENVDRKKILYIITLPDWGGAQKYVFDSAENLRAPLEASELSPLTGRAEFDVTVAHGQFEQNDALRQKCEKIGLKTHKFSHLIRPINPLKDLLAAFEIRHYINDHKPDVVHLNSSKAGILGSFARALAWHKPEVIYTVHGWVFLEPMNVAKRWLYIFLEKLASHWRDKIIVLGEKEKQIALDYKICAQEKLQIINHVIPEIKFLDKKDAREILGLPQDKKIIGTVANFYPAKGLEYLIEAASKIDRPDVIFAIIGDGALHENFKFQISNFKLENKFLLLGEKENAAQYLKVFDLFVLPSVKEGAPFAILEAMAAGLPIIATDVGSVSEMLKDYQDKIIISPADIEALTDAIARHCEESATKQSR